MNRLLHDADTHKWLNNIHDLAQKGSMTLSIGLMACDWAMQVGLLRRQCNQKGFDAVEALTIDKSQGRDKPCMLLSFVRSNAEGLAGRILEDACRLNVALTRAKAKLIMVGCCNTLQQAVPLARLLDLLRANSWLLTLPPDAMQPC